MRPICKQNKNQAELRGMGREREMNNSGHWVLFLPWDHSSDFSCISFPVYNPPTTKISKHLLVSFASIIFKSSQSYWKLPLSQALRMSQGIGKVMKMVTAKCTHILGKMTSCILCFPYQHWETCKVGSSKQSVHWFFQRQMVTPTLGEIRGPQAAMRVSFPVREVNSVHDFWEAGMLPRVWKYLAMRVRPEIKFPWELS